MIATAGRDKTIPAVVIRRLIRHMRGGSQAQLVQATNDCFYVVKYSGNPQGNRTLMNEVIASRLLANLAITTPPLNLIYVPESSYLRDQLQFQFGNKWIKPEKGPHLGSLCPVNPETNAIFDFFPTRLNCRIFNIREFAAMFVFDRWLHNRDIRQTIYYRNLRLKGEAKIQVSFIDHGMILGGSAWEFSVPRPTDFIQQRGIYQLLRMTELTQEAIYRVTILPSDLIFSAGSSVPEDWLAFGDSKHMETVLAELDKRRKDLNRLVESDLRKLNIV